jgi:predicted enzyme related to lactoylglutathione lyase
MSIRLDFLNIEITDYNLAIGFYRDCLGFTIIEDEPLEGNQRWIVMRPGGSNSSDIAFTLVPQVTGRLVGSFKVDDVWEEYNRMLPLGVHFTGEPVEYPFGTGVGLVDPFGNRFFMSGETWDY